MQYWFVYLKYLAIFASVSGTTAYKYYFFQKIDGQSECLSNFEECFGVFLSLFVLL